MGGNKGGSRTETKVETKKEYDEVSARKLAAVAERQQAMAEEQYAMYKEFFMPYEIEAAEANREILPLITEASTTTLGLQAPVTKEFYKQSLEGVDVGERVEQAGAEVVSAMKLGEGMRRREMGRLGIDPSSSTYSNVTNEAAIKTATGVAGARTKARSQAEDENYRRLGYSLGKGVYQTQVGPATDPYARAAGSFAGSAAGYSSLAQRVLNTSGTTSGRQQEYLTPLGATGQVGGALLGAGAAAAGAYYGSGGGK